MRLIAVLLVTLGIELSTRAVSLGLGRLSAGLQAIASGMEFHVSPFRYAAGVGLIVIGAVLLVALFLIERTEQRVGKVGDRCPACGGTTQRVKRRRIHRMLAMVMGQRLTRRQCEDCHWVGLSLRF